jgi:DNA (cytosine-5)-methyltransferase 1
VTGRLKVGSLFAGVGGLDLGVTSVFDAETVWFVEFDANPSKVLAARFPGVPNFGDITQVNWAEVEPVDILIGGFPCQDVSSAGLRAGLASGTRSGLWSYFREAIDALRPRFVVIENVRGLLSATANREDNNEDESFEADGDVELDDAVVGDDAAGAVLRAAGAVLGDLAAIGYDAQWVTVPASLWGTPHRRERVFIVAHPAGIGLEAIRDSIREPEARQWFDGGTVETDAAATELGDDRLLPTPTALVAGNLEADSWLRYKQLDPTDLSKVRDLNVMARAGLLPTPQAQDGNGHAYDNRKPGQQKTIGGELRQLVNDAKMLPTPTVSDQNGAPDGTDPRDGSIRAPRLSAAVKLSANEQLLPTPTALDDVEKRTMYAGGALTLRGAVEGVNPKDAERLLPTPRTTDAQHGPWHNRPVGGDDLVTIIDTLNTAAADPKMLPTPVASQTRKGQRPEVRKSYGKGMSVVELVDVATTHGEPYWKQYEPAINRWSALFRPAPPAVRYDNNNKPQLSARFAEWMMGWPEGWVDVEGVSERKQLKMIGNGVVPQQAAGAVRIMLGALIQELRRDA